MRKEELFNYVCKSVSEGIHIVNKEGRTLLYNDVMSELEGSRKKESSTIIKAMETGKPIVDNIEEWWNKDGKGITTINSAWPIFEDGKIVGAVEVARDVSRVRELIDDFVCVDSNVCKDGFEDMCTFDDIVGDSPRLSKAKEIGRMASRTSSNVLIIGESGTGKELFAEAIHNYSDRRNMPYIVENCAAIPANLLESLLFGTVKGAFTGAIDRIGLFQQADGGTLVLDEINSMPMSLQSKLLRVLQEGRFRPIGGEKEEEVNVRIIAITNKDPLELIRKGKLREDLFYRLSVVNLFIPPLRKRGKEDIDLLTEFFIKNISGELMKRDITISDEMMEYFYSYSWPGNVRELENIIEGAINLLNDGEKITLRHLPYYLKNDVKFLEGFPRDTKSNSIESIIEEDISLHDYLDCIEKEIVKEALDMADGNVTKAAKILKITRQSLQYKIDKK